MLSTVGYALHCTDFAVAFPRIIFSEGALDDLDGTQKRCVNEYMRLFSCLTWDVVVKSSESPENAGVRRREQDDKSTRFVSVVSVPAAVDVME